MIKIDESKNQDCCGCGACVSVCPRQCITMIMDREGFLYPRVDEDQCINCNLCEKVCPIIKKIKAGNSDTIYMPRALGGWHKDEVIRMSSSSGGAFSLFAIYIIEHGGIVYGAAVDEKMRTRHMGVENVEDLQKLRGSKYVQSDIDGVYKEIENWLSQGRKVFFVGTPCQAAGLTAFLKTKYEGLYIADFICHGVPSPKVFESYLEWISQKYGSAVIDFKFRLKDKPWNPSGMQMGTKITLNNGKVLRRFPAYKDFYMNGFLDDLYLRPSCYNCRFKSLPKEYVDITFADFWGADRIDKTICDRKGTSLLLLHSKKAEELFEKVKGDFYYKEYDILKAIRRNQSLIKSAEWNSHREKFFRDYENKSFIWVAHRYMSGISWASHKAGKVAWGIVRNIIQKSLGSVLSLIHVCWSDKEWNNFFQFIKFAIVGLSNTVVSYLINIFVLTFLKVTNYTYDYVVANTIAFLLSVPWSFFWNSRMVFVSQGNKRSPICTLLKTYMSYAFTGIIVNNLLSTIWIRIFRVTKYLAPLLNLPFSMLINFFINKFWAYKE